MAAGPFAEWLNTHLPPDTTIAAWEIQLEVGVDSLRKIASGERQFTSLDFVDRVLCAYGAHLIDVYPDLYREELS